MLYVLTQRTVSIIRRGGARVSKQPTRSAAQNETFSPERFLLENLIFDLKQV